MRSRLPLLGAALVFACVADQGPPGQPPAPATTAATPRVSAASTPAPLLPRLASIEELTTLRDPFVPAIEPTPPPIERENVAFPDSPVRDLRVTGTVAGGADGKAIIADSRGETRVLAVGQRLGQLEKNADGSRAEWRVDRVREGNVVLLREGGNVRQTAVLGEVAGASKRKRSTSKPSGSPRR